MHRTPSVGATRKGRAGGRGGTRETFGYSTPIRIATWNCGGLLSVAMSICKDFGYDILGITETHGWNRTGLDTFCAWTSAGQYAKCCCSASNQQQNHFFGDVPGPKHRQAGLEQNALELQYIAIYNSNPVLEWPQRLHSGLECSAMIAINHDCIVPESENRIQLYSLYIAFFA